MEFTKTKKIASVAWTQTGFDFSKLVEEVDGIIIKVGARGWAAAGPLNKDAQFANHIKGAIKYNIPYGFYFTS